MKVVVDTNIVFSAILNTSGNIGKVLINYGRHFDFYSCNFLKSAIALHEKKLLKLTKLDKDELDELITLCTKNIRFINENIIPKKHWQVALKKLEKVDPKDTPFVALAYSLKSKLWTGDHRLIKGLSKQGFTKFVKTQDLLDNIKVK